jgi:hypothetical protein
VADLPIYQPPEVDALEVFKYVRFMLGEPVMDAEVENETLEIPLQEALDKYSRLIPKIRWFSMPAFAGVQRYFPPKDTIGYGITDVMIPRIDPIAPLMLSSGPRLDVFGYRYSYPYRDISELYTDYFYFSEATKILSSDFDWEWMNGAIHVSPRPDEPFPLTYQAAFPRDLDSIPRDDVDWIRNHVLALAEISLGRIRRKFRIPGAQSEQILDGQQLTDEGFRRLEQSNEDLLLRTPPLPIYRTN